MSTIRAKKPSKVTVYDQAGRMAGECLLPVEIFYSRVNRRLLEQVQIAYANNRRRGTAATKKRRDVSGGGKKPWRQKGTGRARHGSIREPQWRGGGIVFGPQPKNYVTHIPVQLRRQALISALSLKLAEGKITIVDSITVGAPKTKEWAQILESLKLNNHHTLCVLRDPTQDAKRAAQNLGYLFRLEDARRCSAYEVLKNDRLILEQKAIPALEERLLGASVDGPDGESSEGKGKAS